MRGLQPVSDAARRPCMARDNGHATTRGGHKVTTTTLNSKEATELGFLLAFNLGDLLTIKREEPILMMALIRPVLSESGAIVRFGKQLDEDYIPATDIDAERAQAIVDVIRLKVPRYRLRMRLRKCDRSKRGRWITV